MEFFSNPSALFVSLTKKGDKFAERLENCTTLVLQSDSIKAILCSFVMNHNCDTKQFCDNSTDNSEAGLNTSCSFIL